MFGGKMRLPKRVVRVAFFLILFVLSVIIFPGTSFPKEKKVNSPAYRLAYCVDKMARKLGVDPLVLLAIYKVESRWHPYAIGVRKGRRPVRSVFPKTRERAIKLVKWYIRRGYQVDLGIAQINYTNIKRWGLKASSAFDICKSVRMSAVVLANCMNRYGRTWKAVDCYNKGFHPYVRNHSSYTRKVRRTYYKLARLYKRNRLATLLKRQVARAR